MQVSGQTKIYKKDFNGRPSYSRCIASQEYKDGKKGDWIRVYESVQFPKDADIPDRSIVEVKGFEATYNSRNGAQRKLVVTEYKVMDAPRQSNHQEQEPPQGFTALNDDDIPF